MSAVRGQPPLIAPTRRVLPCCALWYASTEFTLNTASARPDCTATMRIAFVVVLDLHGFQPVRDVLAIPREQDLFLVGAGVGHDAQPRDVLRLADRLDLAVVAHVEADLSLR